MPKISDIEETPNPNAVKFILREAVSNGVARQYGSAELAENDPLAKSLFDVGHVVSVFYMDKFVTIEKSKDANWGQIQRPFIDFLKSFNPELIPAEKEVARNQDSDDELLRKINELLDQKVRPALAGDGGGLEVIAVDGITVKIKYQGACGSCPSAISGTLMAIEGLIRRDIDPMLEVVAA